MPGGTPDRNTVEFGIGVGEYESVVRVSKRVFQILVPDAPTPERCVESYHLLGPGSNCSLNGNFGGGWPMTQCRDHRSRFARAGGPTHSQIFFSRAAP
jgi:hypothetical protein